MSTVTAWSATSVASMPMRQIRADAPSRFDVLAERQNVAAVAHRDRQADRRLAVDAEHRLRRIGKAAPDLRDVAQPEDAPADGEVDVAQMSCSDAEGAGDAQRQRLVAGLDRARRLNHILRLQRSDQRLRSMPSVASSFIETSTKIRSSCAPRISILETSGTFKSSERTFST